MQDSLYICSIITKQVIYGKDHCIFKSEGWCRQEYFVLSLCPLPRSKEPESCCARCMETVAPPHSPEVAKHSLCLHDCRGQLVNAPDAHSLKQGPLTFPSGKRECYSHSGRWNANQLRGSFAGRSLFPPVCFPAVYWLF